MKVKDLKAKLNLVDENAEVRVSTSGSVFRSEAQIIETQFTINPDETEGASDTLYLLFIDKLVEVIQ